ncbi:MAG: nitroreductase family protein [Eubacteriales bacterium]|nr:nitroreductase family protein [Eubacteriales bacterium]
MKKYSFIALLIVCSFLFTACISLTAGADEQTSPAMIVEDIATIQAFTEEAVPEAAVNAIVNAGINAPSSMNSQPWHFSVVTDKAVLEKINGGMGGGMPKGDGAMPEGMTPPEGMNFPGGPQAPEGMTPPEGGSFPKGGIPSSGGAKAGISDAPLVIIVSCKPGSELDAGLATQNMSVEAQLLGYGTKIISSPTISLNGPNQAEYKELLGIPDDMAAVCVLLIGKTNTEEFDAVSGATERNNINEIVTYLN